ncbi:MAG: ATP-binding protein [Candidatus Hermodarchaeota archaeon]
MDYEYVGNVKYDQIKEYGIGTVETRFKKKNGKIIDVLLSSVPINPKDFSAGVTFTALDITERKKAEQELLLLNKLKSELLTRSSHELKTPLMSIKGFTDLLSIKFQDSFYQEELELINEIKKGCNRLEILIRDILNTAELESGTVMLELSKSNLSSVIRECIEELKGFANSRDHTINLILHDNLINIFDIKQIRQVINNIVTNAIKYTPPKGIITIRSETKEKFITISISDTGIGFIKKEIQHLFKRFGKIERFGQGFDVITEGSGLGLYISKKIIEMHGGELWVQSEGRYKGSTFYFTLPLIYFEL